MTKIYSILFIVLLYAVPSNAQGIYQLWGMTQVGGSDNKGTIFSTNFAGEGYQLHKQFEIANSGASPQLTQLTEFNGKFYGVTTAGGSNGSGAIFEWDPASNVYSKKIDFVETEGSGPMGALLLHNGKFYGTTEYGGQGAGVIFEWDPASNVYLKRFEFSYVDYNGQWPKGHLAIHAGKIYGMTTKGGVSDKGVIFEWDPATGIFSKRFDFNGSNGSEPFGNLLFSAGKFYGMTTMGGTHDLGVIFEWDPSSNAYTKKIDFNGVNGSNPYGSLSELNGKLYGVTQRGNPFDNGVIFEWNPVNNLLVKKYDFIDSSGSLPSELTLHSGKFYGMTGRGGSKDVGVLFEWNPSNNVYLKKIDFSAEAGKYPNGKLTYANGRFYGMTPQGGTFNEGVIFEWDIVSNSHAKKIDLNDYGNGTFPTGNLVVKGGKWYGMTNTGGNANKGVIFEWDPETSTYTKKFDFNGNNGSKPLGNLTRIGEKFYGMTSEGGSNDEGVIFEWIPNSNEYTKKFDFFWDNGSKPLGSLTVNDGKLYGMTYEGGEFGGGVIFEFDPATDVYTKKIDLNSHGVNPTGNLSFANGKFYGMTYRGGTGFAGVIFEWDPATNVYTKKFDFNTTGGKSPAGSLSMYNGKFYGLTTAGGTNNWGVIFEWDPSNNTYTKKKDFDNSLEGNRSYGSLTLVGEKFYGMTRDGGDNFTGVMFQWDPVSNIYIKKKDLSGTSTGSYPGVVNDLAKLPAPVAKGLAGSCTDFAAVIIDQTNNNVWVPIIDAKGDAVAEIKANGNNLGLVTASMFINSGTVREDAAKRLYLDRNLTITPAIQPTSAVEVRLYMTESEFLALKNAVNSNGQSSNVNSISDVGVFKNGDSCSAMVVRSINPVFSTVQPWEKDHVFTATINSFSSFYFFSLTQGGPLPVTTLELDGRMMSNNAELSWKTTNESNVHSFDLERSTNGTEYRKIYNAKAFNQSGLQVYNYTDEKIEQFGVPVLFYRVKQIDLDGKIAYSGVVKLNVKERATVVLYPNPVHDRAQVLMNMSKAGNIQVRLLDNSGRLIRQEQWSLMAGNNNRNIDVSGLANGMYTLELVGQSVKEHKQFIKQ